MRNKFLLSTILGGFIAGGYTLATQAPQAEAGAPKNLKVFPKDTDKKVIKTQMKAMSKALGVQCDFCHDMSAGMDKDTKMKEKARSMLRMTNKANATLKKDGFSKKVSCKTCHNGEKVPKN